VVTKGGLWGLARIDRRNGAAAFVSYFDGVPPAATQGFDGPSIAFDTNNTLYALSNERASLSTLYTVDPRSGQATAVRPTNVNLPWGADILASGQRSSRPPRPRR
jgi:hypothetical protein